MSDNHSAMSSGCLAKFTGDPSRDLDIHNIRPRWTFLERFFTHFSIHPFTDLSQAAQYHNTCAQAVQ